MLIRIARNVARLERGGSKMWIPIELKIEPNKGDFRYMVNIKKATSSQVMLCSLDERDVRQWRDALDDCLMQHGVERVQG